MKLQFDSNGNEKQKQAWIAWNNPKVRNLVYGGSKNSGKSYLGCSVIGSSALIYPETHYFIARKKLNDLRKYTTPSMYEVFQHWNINPDYYKFNGQDNYFEFYNGSKIFLIDAKYLPSDPHFYRFGSMQMTHGWIEEAGEFEIEARNNLAATIGRWKNDVYGITGKLLETCNPSKNYLYKIYQAFRDGILEDWQEFIQALPEDNKKSPPGYIENLYRILSTNEKERLLKGNWEYDDDPASLVSYENILAIFTNNFVEPGLNYISADVARYGSDRIVILVWSGLRVVKVVIRSKQSTVETADLIKALAKEYKIPNHRIVIDDDGIGGGVVDQIPNCKAFINNSSALNNENYNNLKSQCGFKLSEKIQESNLFINCQDEATQDLITEELEQLKQANMDKEGKKQIISKDKVKELIGRSPDFSDALLMRMVFELLPGNPDPKAITTFNKREGLDLGSSFGLSKRLSSNDISRELGL